MTAELRFAFRLSCIAVCLLYGMVETFFLFPFYSKRRGLCAIRLWSLHMLASCGMKLETFGTPPVEGRGQLLICNHISWLDIMTVNGAFPGRFITKDDVARWPVVDYLATQAQTVYVTRNKGIKDNTAKINNVTEALQNGDTVALFPEGTSTEGREILPFKPSSFQTAYNTSVPLILVLYYYPNPNGSSPNPHMAYYGDISLWRSICMIIGQPSGKAGPRFLDPIAAPEDRYAAAWEVHVLLNRKQQELS